MSDTRARDNRARDVDLPGTEEAGEVGVEPRHLAGPGGLFDKIRAHVPTGQGQGQVFERLMRAFLTEDPLFHERFSHVHLWSEWPGRHRGEHDTGIDLVAEERDGGLCAIQCKFYGESQSISRDDIDRFLVTSARRPFTARLFVSTTERWGRNAEKILADQHVPVQRLGVAELEASPFDWSRFDPEHPDQLPRHGPKHVRPHQRAAIDDVLSGLTDEGRGKLVMACGTGKTFTALRIAEELVASGGRTQSVRSPAGCARTWSRCSTRSAWRALSRSRAPIGCSTAITTLQPMSPRSTFHCSLRGRTTPARTRRSIGIRCSDRSSEHPLALGSQWHQVLSSSRWASPLARPSPTSWKLGCSRRVGVLWACPIRLGSTAGESVTLRNGKRN